jgi:AsmA protein
MIPESRENAMRWVVRAVMAIVVLALVGVGALFLIPADRIARIAADRLGEATGRSVVIAGDVRPSFWPVLGVSTGAVDIGTAAWSDQGAMLHADRIEIGVDARALIGGAVRVKSVVIDAPVITLHRAADGRVNWDFGDAMRSGGAPSAVGGQTGPRSLSLEEVRITNATVRFFDEVGGGDYRATGLDARLALPEMAGPADLEVSATVNGTDVGMVLRLERTAEALSGAASAMTLTATAGANTLGFEGRGGFAPLAADGALSLGLPDPAAALRVAGLPPTTLPAGLGAPRLTANLTLSPDGRVHLRGATVSAGANRLTGDVDFAPGTDARAGRPMLTASLSAGALDLSAFSGGGADTPATGGGWPTEPIDASGLNALDADIGLTATSVNLGTVALGRTDLRAKLDQGRLVTTIREMQAYEGVVSGQLVVNARRGLSVGGDLKLAGLALQPALTAAAGVNRLAGTGAGAVSFEAAGGSVNALMRSVSGNGNVRLADGAILGLDLAGMLRTLDTSYVGSGSKTIFNTITGSFTMKDGVLFNSDMALTAPLLRAEGAGSVDIGAQTLDYRVTPVALSGADGSGGVRVPLLITGPWAAPRYRLDLEGAAKQNLVKERKALEQKAKDALGAEAAKRGITPAEGETMEDAARRKLEEGAGKALKGLFGK